MDLRLSHIASCFFLWAFLAISYLSVWLTPASLHRGTCFASCCGLLFFLTVYLYSVCKIVGFHYGISYIYILLHCAPLPHLLVFLMEIVFSAPNLFCTRQHIELSVCLPTYLWINLLIIIYLIICMCMCRGAWYACRIQKTTCRSLLSPSIIWIPGIKLRSSGLVARFYPSSWIDFFSCQHNYLLSQHILTI